MEIKLIRFVIHYTNGVSVRRVCESYDLLNRTHVFENKNVKVLMIEDLTNGFVYSQNIHAITTNI